MYVFGFTISATDLSLLGVVGLLLAWFIPHRLSLWRERKTRRASACADFRASILSALSGIYPPTARWPEDISLRLIATLPAVKAACVALAPHLAWVPRKALAKAYRAYEEQCRQEQPFNFLVAHAIDPNGFPENPQTVFGHHVSRLLNCAEET